MDWYTVGAAIAGATILTNMVGFAVMLLVSPFIHA